MRTSEQIGELAAALAAAQGAYRPASRAAVNPHFRSRYAAIEDVIEATRPELTGHGIAVVQSWHIAGEMVELETRLVHASGQWIEDTASAKPRDLGPQAIGSVVTYLRRYSYAAMVGVSYGDDDDGETAEAQAASPVSGQEQTTMATMAQLKAVAAAGLGRGMSSEAMLQGARDITGRALTSARDLTAAEAERIIETWGKSEVENGTQTVIAE